MKATAKRILLSGGLLLLATGGSRAQTVNVVVADADTRQPVAHASLYTKENGRFRSCISNEDGLAHVNFSCQRISVSHLNYEKRTLRMPLPDTILLQPRFLQKAEVVVTNKEPEWIRRCLKQVVKQKQRHYFSHNGVLQFGYFTQSLGTNNIYRCNMTGLLRTLSSVNEEWSIVADTVAITASDSTRLTDTANLRRMLYEDFMADLDKRFISDHRFSHNPDYKGRNDNEVELRFRLKHGTDDRGWMILDTMRCVVLSAERTTGTKTNRQERINAMMYAMARVFGYHIDTWTRHYHVDYAERDDGTLYPANVRYKMYYAGHDGSNDKQQKEFHEQTGGGFPNMEATLTLKPSDEEPDDYDQWLDLPPSWYIAFHSDKERQKEIDLSNLPATFNLFEEENE